MPAQITIRLENDDKVRLGLNRWAKTLAPIAKADIKAAMERARKVSPAYQGGSQYNIAERGGYERTGNLGRSVFVMEEGLSVRIVVEAYRDGQDYGGLVLGDGRGGGQAWFHAGRWPTLFGAVEAEYDQLTNDIDAHLGDSAEAVGL